MTRSIFVLICIQLTLLAILFWPAAEVMLTAVSSLNQAADMLPRP